MFVGWTGALPAGFGDGERLSSRGFFGADLSGCRAVVLGREAIEQLPPPRVAESAASARVHVVLCAAACAPHVVAVWTKLAIADVVPPAELAERLRARPLRRRLGPAGWLSTVPPAESFGWIAAVAVEDLPRFRVAPWARSLRCSKSHLGRACKRDFGEPAKDVLIRYVVNAAKDMFLAHATRQDSAVALGYADGPALCHAIERARSHGIVAIDANGQRS